MALSNGEANTSSGLSVAVIIPAMNEAESIDLVVGDLPVDRIDQIIVVDNNSSDGTGHVAKVAGATVLREARPGYGWACTRGIKHLAAAPPDIVVFLDGDYSDYPEELLKVIEPIVAGRADFVIGSRMLGKHESGALLPQAILGNQFACALIRMISGVRFTDLGPFRAVKYDDLVAMQLREMTYGWTIEMQIKAVKSGLRCEEVPVSYRKRVGKSKVTGTVSGTMKASARILWVLGRYVVFRRA